MFWASGGAEWYGSTARWHEVDLVRGTVAGIDGTLYKARLTQPDAEHHLAGEARDRLPEFLYVPFSEPAESVTGFGCAIADVAIGNQRNTIDNRRRFFMVILKNLLRHNR